MKPIITSLCSPRFSKCYPLMSVLLPGVHSISVLEYLKETFSENFLRMLESADRLCGAGMKLGGGFNLNFTLV